ncbi:MAG: hypothetical protein ACREMY_01490, partial [bacterium]
LYSELLNPAGGRGRMMREGRRRSRWGVWRPVAVAVVILAAIALGVGSGGALGSSSAGVPANAVRVAGASFDHGKSWSVWLYGARVRGICWATRNVSHGLSNVETACGATVPPKRWQLVASGTLHLGHTPQSALVFLVKRGVGKLVATVAAPGSKRVELRAQFLTGIAAKRAHLPARLGYASALLSGRLTCVESVSAFDNSGKRIGHATHLAC